MVKFCLFALMASSALVAPTIGHAQDSGSALGSVSPSDGGVTMPTAQPSSGGITDIVVTAQKRSENLQKVPITIAAVAPEVLQKSGIQSTQGLAAVLPGLQMLNIANNLTPRVRGVGAGFASAGQESSVATFIDGIYHAFSADIEVDYSDVEQIALLKGPQGTLFGRNATGGVLQITTRQPSHDFKGSFQTSLDNYLTSRSNAFVTGGLSESVAASLSLSYATQGKGFGKNFTTGRDNNKLDHSISGMAKIKVDVSDSTTFSLAADYRDSGGALALGVRTVDGLSSINPAPARGDAWDSTSFFSPSIKFKGGGGSLKLDQEFDFATLSLISAYRSGTNAFSFTTATTPTKANLAVSEQKSKQFTQEVQLVSPSGGRFTWTIGAFYFWNKANVDLRFDFFQLAANAVLESSHPITELNTNSFAAFAQGTFKISDSTRLTGGIRYTYDKRVFQGSSANVFRNPLPPFLPPFLAGQTIIATQDESNIVKKPTWRVALDHDLSERIMAYASWNRGMKSGSYNTTAVGDPPVAPERLDAFEAGLKSQLFDNSLRLNLGGFYYDYANLQVPVYNNGVPAIRNADSAEIYGADLDVEAQLSSQLKLTGSVNWLHARFKKFENAPIGVPNPGFQGASFPPGLSAAGNTVPYSPTVTYTIGLDYSTDTKFGPVNFNINDNYNNGFYSEPDNFLRQKRYHLINASLQWTSLSGDFSARIFAENILNKAVASLLATTGTSYNRDVTNPPFRIGAGFKVKF